MDVYSEMVYLAQAFSTNEPLAKIFEPFVAVAPHTFTLSTEMEMRISNSKQEVKRQKKAFKDPQ